MNKTSKLVFSLFYLFLFALTLPIFLGFISFLHPLFDSFSHFRIQLLFLILPLLFILIFLHQAHKYRYLYTVFLVLISFYLYQILLPFSPKAIDKNKTDTLKHLQFNLRFSNPYVKEFKTFLENSDIDVVTLQEVTTKHKETLEELKNGEYTLSKDYPFIVKNKGAYPYQKYCEFQGVGDVAILSKHPINEEKSVCIPYQGLLWSQIIINNKAITVASIHLHWPYPYQQNKQVQFLKLVLEKIPKPTLIAGDFNAVSWSNTLSIISKASKTKVVNGLRWSINLNEKIPLLKLPIDHLLLSKELEVKSIKVGEDLGSDHLPIVSQIAY